MAGSEQGGVEAASHDLFVDATYVVTNSAHTDLAALGQVTEFAQAVGADIEIMTPEEHDAAVAIISHLPHAMSGALLQTAEAAQRASGKTFQLAAGSFRDLTQDIGQLARDLARYMHYQPRLHPRCHHPTSRRISTSSRPRLPPRTRTRITRFFEQASEIREAYVRIAK